MVDIIGALLATSSVGIVAIIGLIRAVQAGEKVEIVRFSKSIVFWLVAGVGMAYGVSETDLNALLTNVALVNAVTIGLDKAANAYLDSRKPASPP